VVTVLAVLLIVVALIFNWDPILNIFYWFSSVAVLAIVLTEILVSIAVIVYFRRTREDTRVWNTLIAPALAALLLLLGEIALVSRFNLLAGVASGEGGPFEMNGLGWFLVSLPLIFLVIGLIVGALRRNRENYDAVHNFVS
jgi:amino acid transporter